MIYQSYVVFCRIFVTYLLFVFGLHEVCIVDLEEVCKVDKKNQRALLVPANCKPCIWDVFSRQLEGGYNFTLAKFQSCLQNLSSPSHLVIIERVNYNPYPQKGAFLVFFLEGG